MADDRRTKRRQLFEAAVELPRSKREAFLREQCAGDDELRSSVDDLLRLDDEPEPDFLQSPVHRESETRPAFATGDLPANIGRYRVTGLIGAGGMGVVYEGAQEAPQRAVAIKVIRPELISDHMLSRFRNEAEVLGRLDHPGIARIYEAGTAPLEGSPIERPFFAMELVRGTRLLDYGRDLGTTEKLRLFAEIGDAVHHAHQKGVIHRDLKPANIIVTPDGQPKILDFGIARVTDADIQVVTVQTDAGQVLGTVPYMSPEQVIGDLGRLDSRSDVYSLGVVLFELLTGALPHDVRERSIPEAVRIIHDEDSTLLSTLAPALRGDVEWILAKALEKETDRRYDSASAFAADIRRHLADEPVLAGPPSASYRLRKFVRRNKGGVAWATMAMLLLVAGISATVVQTVRATRAEKQSRRALVVADREADRARVGLDFLIWGFGRANDRPEGDAISLRQTLDLAAAGIDARFQGRPEAQADVRRLIGQAYWEISAYGPAKEQLALAAVRLRPLYEDGPDANARALVAVLGMLQACERELGQGEDAAAQWYWEGVDVARERLSRKSPALGRAITEMREAAARDGAVADERIGGLLDQASRAFERDIAPDDPDGIYFGYALLVIAQAIGMEGAVLEEGPAYPIAYLRAALAVLGRLPIEDAGGMLAMGLWMEARSPAPDGEHERRIEVARQLERIKAVMPSRFFQIEAEGILGDALLQRGQADDGEDIARRLIESHRQMRAMRSPDAVAHAKLGSRRSIAMLRLAGLGLGFRWQNDDVINLLDRPDVLDELASGIARETLVNVLGLVSRSMLSRTGRSDRWYEVGRMAGERGIELSDPAG